MCKESGGWNKKKEGQLFMARETEGYKCSGWVQRKQAFLCTTRPPNQWCDFCSASYAFLAVVSESGMHWGRAAHKPCFERSDLSLAEVNSGARRHLSKWPHTRSSQTSRAVWTSLFVPEDVTRMFGNSYHSFLVLRVISGAIFISRWGASWFVGERRQHPRLHVRKTLYSVRVLWPNFVLSRPVYLHYWSRKLPVNIQDKPVLFCTQFSSVPCSVASLDCVIRLLNHQSLYRRA